MHSLRPAMTILGLALAAAIAASPASGAARRAAPPPTPAQGTASFFNAYMRNHPLGIPNAAVRARLMPFLTARLHALLQDGERAETRYAEATKHEVPPLVESDIFTSLFEGATSFAVGPCMSESEIMASCTVDLTYKSQGQADTHWTDTVVLVREQRRYRVDDVIYGGTWPFANKGRLSDMIAAAIAESQMPAN